jgi:chemotaxis protein CheC
MEFYESLTEEDINDLKEIGSIGVGQAASKLASMINKRCFIDIPEVAFLDKETIEETFDLENTYAVGLHIKIMGDIPADMIVISKRSYAQKVVGYITKTKEEMRGKDMSYTAQMALRQIGEVLTRAFGDSLNSFINLKTRISIPSIIGDTGVEALNKIIDRLSREGKPLIIIHSRFYDREETFDGRFIYIINQESCRIIINKLKELFKSD